MHAVIPDAKNGDIPRVKFFHFAFPVRSACPATYFIANAHSVTLDTCTAHVGTDNAFDGS